MVAHGTSRPDLVLADYNLPGGMSGLQAAGRLREALPGIPVIILTGDISDGTMQEVARPACRQLNKPVKPSDLAAGGPGPAPGTGHPAQDARPQVPPAPSSTAASDQDAPRRLPSRQARHLRRGRRLRHPRGAPQRAGGGRPHGSRTSRAAKRSWPPTVRARKGCLLVDAAMPGMDGLEVLRRLGESAGDQAAGHHDHRARRRDHGGATP